MREAIESLFSPAPRYKRELFSLQNSTMKFNSYHLYFFICFGLFFSCKKYEEGPALSFRSKAERLANHWKYEKKLINNEEVELTEEEKNTTLIFDKSGAYIKRIPNGPYFTSYQGTWEFTDRKEKIKTFLSYTYFGNPVTEEREWEIVKLKEKELWLRYVDGNEDKVEARLREE